MMIDFYAHVLPGMDDGCPTRIVAIRQLLMAARAGVDVLVAAPELDLNRIPADLFLRRRAVSAEHLELLLQEGMPRVVIGAEVLWHPELEDFSSEELAALCVGEGGWLLLRLPEGGLNRDVIESLRRLLARLRGGIVIADADQLSPDDAQTLFSLGCKGALRFSALEHHHGREAWLPHLKNGDIAALGSGLRGSAKVYRKLHRLPGKLDGALEAVMERAAAMLEMAEADAVSLR